MLTFDQALEKILKHAHRLPAVKVPIEHSLGFVLAEEIKAREPIPLFDSSSVDGFAVRVQDIKNASRQNQVRMKLQGTIMAGHAEAASLKPMQAIKIMTGALLPKNADAVVMKEYTAATGEGVVFSSAVKTGENLRRRGEEFAKREKVLLRGAVITPPVIGMCATLGRAAVKVYRKPVVAIIVTGNELRSVSAHLHRGEIRDSNSYAVSAALAAAGIPTSLVLHVRDDKQAIAKAFARALKKADVVISVGGVSVGDHDFVKQVLDDLRVKTIFWRVAMKPGKPNYFGTRGRKMVFGLPGNPVSAIVSLETLVMPALRKMMGILSSETLNHLALLESDIHKNAGRVEFIRAIASRMVDGQLSVRAARGQGSHMVGGIAEANCLIVLPRESEYVQKGERVLIRSLSWNRI